MSTWNAHQKLGNAIKRMDRFEANVRATRGLRTRKEKRANTLATRALWRAFYDAQSALFDI